MLTLNEYKMEFKGKKNEGYYKVFSVLSPILFILSVASVFPTIFVSLYFLITVILLFLCSISLDIIAKRNVFTIEYVWNENIFSILRIDIDGKEKNLQKINCDEIKEISFVESVGDGADYTDKEDFSDKKCVKITKENQAIYVSLDKYMYSLISLGGAR